MGSIVGPPHWRPKDIASADLARGYRMARELQRTPLPTQLGKALSGYILRAGTELTARGLDPQQFTVNISDE
jgi:hypothetical protein